MSGPVVVAIDGPAGSGKSTVGRLVAERLGVEVLDTGAMYRAVTLLVLRAGVDPSDEDEVALVAKDAHLEVGDRVTSRGVDLTDQLRTDDVNSAVSIVAAHRSVRELLVAQQREWIVRNDGGVVEGRDIGSVVAPHATVKVFLTASPQARDHRRADEGATSVARRDQLDAGRAVDPLRRAVDAHVLDTTHRSAQDVAEEILSWL